MPKLSIIIPAYNEEKRIENTLNEYVNFFSARYGDNYELLVMTDGCTDNTVPIVKAYCASHPHVFNYHYNGRRGKGGAIIEGYRHAHGDLITYADADGSVSAEWLYRLITNLNGDDGVIASRYIKGADIKINQSMSRRIASRTFNLLVRSLIGLSYKDTQCGGKVLKKYVVNSIVNNIQSTNWGFDVDLLYNANKKGYSIKEVPIQWSDKKDSKVRLGKIIPIMFLTIIRLRVLNSPFGLLITNPVVSSVYRKMKI